MGVQVVTDFFFWKMIVQETSGYASQINEKEDANERNLKWFPITVDEMERYIALYIYCLKRKKS